MAGQIDRQHHCALHFLPLQTGEQEMLYRLAAISIFAATLATASSAPAESPGLAAVDFLVGNWSASDGGAGPNKGGHSTFVPDVQGKIMLRRDHVVLRAGGALDIMMPIYPCGDTLCAEFYD